MALSSSPRKVVPLAGGDDWQLLHKPIKSGPTRIKRVFYCGVVVENSENGRNLPEDVQDLVASLGEPLDSDSDDNLLPTPADSLDRTSDHDPRRTHAMTESSALTDLINELVSTERTYLKRLQTLKYDYADPLRRFSRSKETAILPPYEAKTLFGNIDNLLPVNEAFLADLEKMLTPDGSLAVGGVGDVALRHFRDLRGFEHYKGYYDKREEAQTIFLREMAKKSSGFAAFIDRIKYLNADARNRVGLRELLMEPVQRIPRYTLLFRAMIKHMAPGDLQYQKLLQADEIASKIAQAEANEETKQASIWYCLSASVEGFPPGLISNSRRFIDCIDVEDMDSVASSASTSTSSFGNALHCTLFLFDDKLVIVKRPGNGEKSGKSLAGLDEMAKMAKAGGLPLGMKKSGMSFKGVVDITEVVAADVGGPDMHFYLENPPQDQSDRWSGRSFRALSVIHPPSPINLDPTKTQVDKTRFLENLWTAQATFRTKLGQSVVLSGEEMEVESRGGKSTLAKTYFNIYQRTAFLQESKKPKIVVHIDYLGSADPIPFGVGGPPFVRVRVQPMAGELSRYTVTSNDPNDESEEDIVQTGRIPARIVQTIHQFGLFKFRTGNISAPPTPTAALRSRAHIFGLDAISRNLFNSKPGSTKGDLFGGSINGHRRSKTASSKASTMTQTTATADGSLMKFSSCSNSTATLATTMSTMDDSVFGSGSKSSRTRSHSLTRKLLKRGRSPGESGSDRERASPLHTEMRSNPGSRSPSMDRELEYSDVEWDDKNLMRQIRAADESDIDLSMRLELARRNSKNQHGRQIAPLDMELPVEETIYEDEPPRSGRPSSRTSKDTPNFRSTAATPRPTTPLREMESPRPSRPSSMHSTERRPLGPRSPSPLPPRSALMLPSEIPDTGMTLEGTLVNLTQSSTLSRSDSVTSSRRQSNRPPLLPTGNTEMTPKPSSEGNASGTEPLSIKKKTSGRSSESSTYTRKTFTRNSPLSRTSAKVISPRRVSPQIRNTHARISNKLVGNAPEVDQLLQLATTTKEDVESSQRAVKKIRLELEGIQTNAPRDEHAEPWRSPSPVKGLSRGTLDRDSSVVTREAQERMNEMRQLIGKRLEGDSTPRQRHSVFPSSATPRNIDTSSATTMTPTLQELVSQASSDLSRAASNYGTLYEGIKLLTSNVTEKILDLERVRVELQNTKRQCELVKSLLSDATAEKEIMYEAFNEELDGMYNDANLPEDEAWTSMTTDLRCTKESRNELTRENSQLKRRIAEMECQQDEWATLLKAHGLIP